MSKCLAGCLRDPDPHKFCCGSGFLLSFVDEDPDPLKRGRICDHKSTGFHGLIVWAFTPQFWASPALLYGFILSLLCSLILTLKWFWIRLFFWCVSGFGFLKWSGSRRIRIRNTGLSCGVLFLPAGVDFISATACLHNILPSSCLSYLPALPGS